MAKRDLSASVSSAARVDDLDDRFSRASETIRQRPSGLTTDAGHDDVALAKPAQDAHEEGKGAYMSIPVADIIENPFNARRIYRQDRIEKLAVSIAAEGQIVPGIATIRDGRYVLVAGHYRLRAIKLAGVATIGVMLRRDLTDQQLYKLSFEENDERDTQTTLDNAMAWRDLLDRGVYKDEVELAAAIGKSAPTVNKTLSVLKVSDDVLDIVKQDPSAFPLTALYELFLYEKVAGAVQACGIATQILAGDIGRREIQEQRVRLEAPKKERKKKETSRQYRIMSGGQPVGAIKDFDDGRVKLEVVMHDQKERESLVLMLKEKFGLH